MDSESPWAIAALPEDAEVANDPKEPEILKTVRTKPNNGAVAAMEARLLMPRLRSP
jgi:hypothetical protein